MKLKAAGGHYLLLSPFPLGFSALCWTFWKHLGLVFLCVLVIPAFTSLFVYHYLPAPSNLVGVIQLPPLEPQAPLHLSTSPHSPHSWLYHPPPPHSFWSGQSFHFICENHLVLFLHFCASDGSFNSKLFHPLHVLCQIYQVSSFSKM